MRRKTLRLAQVCVFAAALGASCAPAQFARADPLEGADPAPLLACVEASASREALDQCRGIVLRACRAANGPGSMPDVLCLSAEADAWQSVLDAATARLSAVRQFNDPARLARANEAWSQWLEAECEYWAWEEGGGSGEQYVRVECAANMTADRAIALRAAAMR